MNPMWDERYRVDDYVYGTSANDFLQSQVDRLPMGQVLCLAEGEGRNAVFLAERGFDVIRRPGEGGQARHRTWSRHHHRRG